MDWPMTCLAALGLFLSTVAFFAESYQVSAVNLAVVTIVAVAGFWR